MAGMEIVAAAVVATGKFLCGSIYSKIKGIIKFQSNLDILEREMKGLLAVKDEVQTETDSAEKEGKVLRTQVIEWLKEVEELQLQVNQIQEKKLSRQSLNCRKRYGINREVVEKLKEIKRLLEAGSSHCGAVAVNHSMPSAVEHIPGPTIQDQTTPSKTLAEIMTLLSDNEVRRIGIWGMGGVGKTTLVRNLNNKLKSISSTQPFGIIIWVTISLNLDMRKVQEQIAERLNLERKMGESMEKLASRLYRRLQKEEKFLLILDDVWEKIDLDNLGVPQPEDHKGSMIILTTRFFDVCRHMMTDVQVKVAVLNDEESWQLFSRNAGNLTNLEHIRPFAKAIVRECCGLPLALVTMGAAMREKTKVELWKHALNELRRPVSCPPNIADKIYKPLKWSYDSLEGKNIKYCFLYCSLFPEDFSIAISELARCWLAEGLLDEQENYEDSFNCVIHLIENLKDSCLLEDGAHEDTVKMHDVVRDVAIWIASSSEDGCKSLVRSGIGLSEMSVVKLSYSPKRVSFMNNKLISLPDFVVQCSEVSTLLLQGNRPLDRVPERFLQGFEALRVLNMSETRIQSMPLSLLQLGELRALLLGGCSCLEGLPPLGGLSKLQVLDLSLTCIRELPKGMENLSNLMHLSLSRTRNLKTIQAGIISRLSNLEVLDMTRSGYCFSVKRDVQEEMACFEELKCLKRLLVLYIRLERIPYFSDEDLSWMDKLRQFNFSVGPTENYLESEHEKEMVWSLSSLDLTSEERIGPLLSNASSLNFHKCLGLGNMLEDLVINSVGCFAGLKSLTISNCDPSVRGRARAKCDLLPNLEKLCLRELKNRGSILLLFDDLRLGFQHLKLLEVEWCSNISSLFDCDDDFFQSLPNLEVIKVRHCDMLVQLFTRQYSMQIPGAFTSTQNIAPHPVVPSLRILELESLPRLSTLSGCLVPWAEQDRVHWHCKRVSKLPLTEETWPLLEQVHVSNCNRVSKLPLTDQNAENIKEIKGESRWWNELEWHTETTKSSLQPYFHPIRDRNQRNFTFERESESY